MLIWGVVAGTGVRGPLRTDFVSWRIRSLRLYRRVHHVVALVHIDRLAERTVRARAPCPGETSLALYYAICMLVGQVRVPIRTRQAESNVWPRVNSEEIEMSEKLSTATPPCPPPRCTRHPIGREED